MPPLWMLVGGAAALYCAVRAILDIRAKRYLLALAGAVLALALLLTPVQPQSVKLDLPRDEGR
jgi:hypothetical protein